MPDLACAAAAARTTPLAPIRPAISISTRVIRLLTTPILGSEVPGDFSRVNPLALLRPRRERPGGHAAEQRDERAAVHSITSSTSASSVCGISRPRLGPSLFVPSTEPRRFDDPPAKFGFGRRFAAITRPG